MSNVAVDTPVEGAASIRGRVRASWALYVLFFLTAGAVGAWISWRFLGASLAALGIPDPGPATTLGLPLLRAGGWVLAALAAGSFLLSGFLVSPRTDDLRTAELSVDGAIAARTGAWSALCLSAVAFLMVPMYLSDVSGEPLVEAMKPANWSIAVGQVSTSLAWLWVGILAAATGVVGVFSRTWIMQPVLLLGSILMIVPLGLEGHSATGGDHDYGTNSYLWHLLFTVLWVGGLMALIAHGRRRGVEMRLAVSRYSTVALVAVAVMAISGLINAAIRIEFSDWLTTDYGWLITAKFVGVIVLAGFGWAHRAWAIPKLDAQPGLFRQVATVEVLLMAAMCGVAVSLGRTPPPPPREPDLNTMDIQLGYKLFVEPTIWNVWTMWRFDIVFGTLAIVLAVAYLWGVWRLRSRGEAWSWGRTAWFLTGCLMLLVTMCSGIGMNMPATFSMHMVGHMILSMGVPVFWVLGGPLTLWLAALQPGEPGRPGPREWLEVAIDNPVVRFLTNPAVNTIQFLVIFYILYLTPLYDVAVSEHAGHLGMNVIFIWSGVMYYWELIGIDPLPGRGGPMGRLAWLSGSLPFHMWFGVTLMQMQTILAEEFYSTLGLPWEMNLLHDQNVGGGIAWASGQFPLVIVFGALLIAWYRDDRRQMRTYDAHADATGDEEMEAYNAMLAQMNAGGERFN
ncbi:cytochrome c oxidase assembly protein [Corynebacterium sp.]|uniref:cytochrome c oxidase assembly protein n=1 Tax=Corynebacterium sp. TaxID=1720 RepID=UPI0026DCFEDA|nr:cytochrome c oxidase assembly protein [Corynebacterium sp.]MDO5076177.1 cytochrome c oxidase assembly protein [Corynebacterium sp.]